MHSTELSRWKPLLITVDDFYLQIRCETLATSYAKVFSHEWFMKNALWWCYVDVYSCTSRSIQQFQIVNNNVTMMKFHRQIQRYCQVQNFERGAQHALIFRKLEGGERGRGSCYDAEANENCNFIAFSFGLDGNSSVEFLKRIASCPFSTNYANEYDKFLKEWWEGVGRKGSGRTQWALSYYAICMHVFDI